MSERQLIPTGGNNILDTKGLDSLLAQANALDSGDSVAQVESSTPVPPLLEQPAITAKEVEAVDPVVQPVVDEKIFDVPDDARVRVKIDGKEEIVTAKDYRDTLQREAMWTKRQQTLADQRRVAENEIAQMYAQLQVQAQVLQAQAQSQQQQPNVVEQLLAFQQMQNQKQPKPDELVAHGELQEALNRALGQVQQQQLTNKQEIEQGVAQGLNAMMQKIRVQQEQERFTTALHQVMDSKDAEILNRVVPDKAYAEAIIRHNVARMGAQSPDEGIQFAKQFVAEWVKTVKKETLGERQAESAQKAKQVLEPTGSGSAPGPQKPQGHQTIFKKTGEIDWKNLSDRAHAFVSQLEA